MRGIKLADGNVKAVEYALVRAGLDPEKCTVVSPPVLTRDGTMEVFVKDENGRQYRVEF